MYQHVSVICPDRVIIVDGTALRTALPAPENLHAVQWHNGKGEMEFTDGRPNTTLEGEKDYAAQVAPFVALWEAEKVRLAEEANRPPTVEEQIAAFTNAIQNHLDGFAQMRNYDGIMSAATYAASTVPKFRTEGQYAVAARDAVWATAYAILDEVLAGARPMPTIEDVIAELPPLAWPEVEP